MSAVRPPDECGGGDLPVVRDHAIEPGPLADPPTLDQPTGQHVAAKARALADFACQHHDYDPHLRRIASAWTEIFHHPLTIHEVAAALAALEILHADH